MTYELPALPDAAAAALAVGLLFCLRFALALRRLRGETGVNEGLPRNLWGARVVGAFGADREPERRHALRQLVVGLVFVTLSAMLLVWIGWTALHGPLVSDPVGR